MMNTATWQGNLRVPGNPRFGLMSIRGVILIDMKNIPNEEICRQLMTRFTMLPNIVEHSYRVAQLAIFLGKRLNRMEADLDLELLRAASLLHDITKTRSLKTREHHAETGRQLLLSLGYPEVAEIVGRHVKLEIEDSSLPLSELHLVNYSDKRVRHTSVVSLEERFEDLLVRYGTIPKARPRIEQMREETIKQEQRLFSCLGFPPTELEAFNSLPVFDLINVPSALHRVEEKPSSRVNSQ